MSTLSICRPFSCHRFLTTDCNRFTGTYCARYCKWPRGDTSVDGFALGSWVCADLGSCEGPRMSVQHTKIDNSSMCPALAWVGETMTLGVILNYFVFEWCQNHNRSCRKCTCTFPVSEVVDAASYFMICVTTVSRDYAYICSLSYACLYVLSVGMYVPHCPG